MFDIQPIVPDAEVSGRPVIIAGPCSAESRQQVLDTASALSRCGIKIFRAGLWKPRTHPGEFEGVGSQGLEWLKTVKERFGMLTATEVANKEHVEAALAAGVDIVWIGARTVTNPFAVQEIADSLTQTRRDVAVLVKNPVNPDLELWVGALQRLYNAGVRRLGAVHRGFSVYGQHLYRNEPIWRIPLELARLYPNLPLLCDPSHIAGDAQLIDSLAQQACHMDFDGLMIETHLRPSEALSDSRQQVTPDELKHIISHLNVGKPGNITENIELLRQEIDRDDHKLIETLAHRMNLSRQIAALKKDIAMPVVQTDRYDEIVKDRTSAASKLGLDTQFIRHIMATIHEESVRQQLLIYKSQFDNKSSDDTLP